LFRKRRQLLDMHSFVQSLDENDNQTILNSDSYFAKALRKKQRANAVGTHVQKSKRKIQQNLFVPAFVFATQFCF
jgi:uncharacterized protein VirK/YbjX